VINERQQMAEQAGEEFHGQPHDTRSRSEKGSTGTGQTESIDRNALEESVLPR